MDIIEWIQYGIDNGFCSEPVCGTHDGYPLTAEEELAYDEGDDVCVCVIRVWND